MTEIRCKGQTETETTLHTFTIDIHYTARGTILVESALGHLGEDLFHHVHPVPLLQVGQKFRAVSNEIVIEKMIHEENLANYDEQIEKFTEDELGDIEIVFANGLYEVLNNCHPAGTYHVTYLYII